MITVEQEAALERVGEVVSLFYEVSDALAEAGWSRGQRRYALREASGAISGVNVYVSMNQLDEVTRRLDLALRVLVAVASTANLAGFVETPQVLQ